MNPRGVAGDDELEGGGRVRLGQLRNRTVLDGCDPGRSGDGGRRTGQADRRSDCPRAGTDPPQGQHPADCQPETAGHGRTRAGQGRQPGHGPRRYGREREPQISRSSRRRRWIGRVSTQRSTINRVST